MDEWIYLDTSFIGLYPQQVRVGYDEFLDEWMQFKISGKKTILDAWLHKTQNVRTMLANFIGALPVEIAFTMNTGAGLNIIINGTSWKKGDNVVFPSFEHNPLDTYTLRKHGVEIRVVESKEGKFNLEDIEKAIDDNTKIVQISQVSYVNGFRFEMKEIAEISHEHGAKLLVDATQAVGALVIDVKKDDVDYLSAAPYKYLLGPAGVAFLYIKQENIEDLIPDRVGWKNQIWEGEHAEEPKNNTTAEKFEYGTLHFQGIYGLEKSLDYLNRIGIENIERRNLELSSYLWSRLSEVGKAMYTPKGTKSPVVSYFQNNASKIAEELMRQKIKVTGREAHGGHIRASTHFYNTKEDIDNFIKAIS